MVYIHPVALQRQRPTGRLDFVDIVTDPAFLRNLGQAAQLSYEQDRETAFSVLLEPDLRSFYQSAIVLGNHTITPLYDAEDMPKNLTTAGGYSLFGVTVHFHPPNSELTPSFGDMISENQLRRTNREIRQLGNRLKENLIQSGSRLAATYGFDVEKVRAAVDVDVNNVAVIGLTLGDRGRYRSPRETEIIVYQEVGQEPLSMTDTNFRNRHSNEAKTSILNRYFTEFVQRYVEKLKQNGTLTRDKIPTASDLEKKFRQDRALMRRIEQEIVTQPDPFGKPYYKVAHARVVDGKIPDGDLEKLRGFALV